MPKIHRPILIASLAGLLALAGCTRAQDPGENRTRSDPFDGGAYAGEHTRSDLDAGMGASPRGPVGADASADPDRAAVDAQNRQRFGQDIGVDSGAGAGRDRSADDNAGSAGTTGR
jgi:hypothetical protein